MVKMSAASSEQNKILPEVILNLRDRLKHGQNVAKILESQIDTAQQNISLLQGQVRLATETILNLKKHFQDTENILEQLMSNDQNTFEIDMKEVDQDNQGKHILSNNVDSTTRSPQPSENSSCEKSVDEKNEQNKSPYAQQLRQVLDVLTDEDIHTSTSSRSTKPMTSSFHHHHHHHDGNECVNQSSQRRHFSSKCDCGSSNCSSNGESYNHSRRTGDEFGHGSKHKEMQHVHHMSMSPNPYERKEISSRSKSPPFHHCSGPCCGNEMSGEYSRSMHFVSMHSPPLRTNENIPPSSGNHIMERRHHTSHCLREGRPYVAYVPYAGRSYHMVDGALSPGEMHLSPPSAGRKRPHIPLMPGDEPPHLKYTKVKRIDGSKLTAQKVLHDFTKRRFCPYNPRFDLDLLIVPPPIPAMDLVKSNFTRAQKQDQTRQPLQEKNVVKENSSLDFYQNLSEQSLQASVDAEKNLENNNYEKDGVLVTNEEKRETCAEAYVLNDHHDITIVKEEGKGVNNSSINQISSSIMMKNKAFPTSMYSSPASRLKIMPPIKEEFCETKQNETVVDVKSKLEDHIDKLRRNENNVNYIGDTNNNGSIFASANEQPLWKDDGLAKVTLNTTS